MFYNESGLIGEVINGATNNITGSIFLTLLAMVIIVILIALVFRVSIEFTAVLIMPLLLVIMAYTSEFVAVGGVFLVYLGILVAKNWIFKIN